MFDLKAIIGEIMRVEPASITIDSDYTSIAVWDSLTQIEVIFRIEDAIGQKFTPEELSQMTSVKNIVRCLGRRGIVCRNLQPAEN